MILLQNRIWNVVGDALTDHLILLNKTFIKKKICFSFVLDILYMNDIMLVDILNRLLYLERLSRVKILKIN